MNWFIEKTKTFPKKGFLMNDFHLKSFPSFPVLVAGTKAIQKARIGNASRSARHLIRKQGYTWDGSRLYGRDLHLSCLSKVVDQREGHLYVASSSGNLAHLATKKVST